MTTATNWPLTKEFYSLHYFYNADPADLLLEAASFANFEGFEFESFNVAVSFDDSDNVVYTGTLIYGGTHA